MGIKEKLSQNRKRKISLLVICGLVLIGAISAICSIESKDAKLPNEHDTATITQQEEEKDKNQSGKIETSEEPEKTDVSKENPKKIHKYTEEEKKELTPEDIKVDNSKDPTDSNKGNIELKPEEPNAVTVTVEIRCDSLSNNMDLLENEAIRGYIPQNGVILAKTKFKGTTENTVFDALNTVCRNNDIHIEYDYTPGFESYYVCGINYLYEMDAGPQSGWMYLVNRWSPNYGCSSYYLRDGDVIEWHYTCSGFGEDLDFDFSN